MTVTIRDYRAIDQADAARIWFESSFVRPGSREELSARIPREIEQAGWAMHVAEIEGRVVAMMAVVLAEKRLSELFVDPPYQNRGVGKALLDFAKLQMQDGFWLTTMEQNVKARHFYEREGLVHVEDSPYPEIPGKSQSRYAWRP